MTLAFKNDALQFLTVFASLQSNKSVLRNTEEGDREVSKRNSRYLECNLKQQLKAHHLYINYTIIPEKYSAV